MIKHAPGKGKPKDEFTLTDKQFKLFVKEAKHWVNFYKLYDYSITYTLREDRNLRGWCSSGNLSDRMIEIGIAEKWNEEITDWQICYVAFHEATEALTMRYYLLANDRSATDNEFREENHTIIHRLQYAIFQPYFDERNKGVDKKKDSA